MRQKKFKQANFKKKINSKDYNKKIMDPISERVAEIEKNLDDVKMISIPSMQERLELLEFSQLRKRMIDMKLSICEYQREKMLQNEQEISKIPPK